MWTFFFLVDIRKGRLKKSKALLELNDKFFSATKYQIGVIECITWRCYPLHQSHIPCLNLQQTVHNPQPLTLSHNDQVTISSGQEPGSKTS